MEPARRSSRTPIPKVPLDYDEPYRKPGPLSKKKPLPPPEETTPTRPGPASKRAKIAGSPASQSLKKEVIKFPSKSPEKPNSPVKNKPGPASRKISQPEEVEEMEEPTETEETIELEKRTEPKEAEVKAERDEAESDEAESDEAESDEAESYEAESDEASPAKRKAEDPDQKENKKIKTETNKDNFSPR